MSFSRKDLLIVAEVLREAARAEIMQQSKDL